MVRLIKGNGEEVKLFASEFLCFSIQSSDGKESACNAGDPGLIPGLG